MKKWRIEAQDLWLIYIPKGVVNIDEYPAIKRHLWPFKEKLIKRATKQEWFELQQAQAAYVPSFLSNKIIYGHFSPRQLFSFEHAQYFSNDKSYIIPNADYVLLGLLNSSACWWLLSRMTPAVRGGFHEVRVQYVETLPIPAATGEQRTHIAQRAEACQLAAEQRRDKIINFRRLTASRLAPGGLTAKLNTKLNDWHALDFSAFRAEVKKQFKTDIPLKDQLEWEDLFKKEQDAIARLDADIARHEREIDAAVYALFKLNDEEIALIESS